MTQCPASNMFRSGSGGGQKSSRGVQKELAQCASVCRHLATGAVLVGCVNGAGVLFALWNHNGAKGLH